MLKIVILVILALDFALDLTLLKLSARQRKLPVPENVRDVYPEAEYQRFLEYSREKSRLHLLKSGVSFGFVLLFLLWPVPEGTLYAAIASALPGSGSAAGTAESYIAAIAFVVVITVLETLLDLPFSFYNTMRIEEKYGFNRSSKKTFFLDEIKGLLIGIVLIAGLVSACILFYTKAGKYFGLFLYLIFALFTVLFSMFSMTFMKIFSRFTPLPAGDLRDRLTQMFTEAGFRLKNIYVSNASLRSTTANAYCTGLGRYKEIVLYDTLVDRYSNEEIEAVFAHELTHYRYHDTMKNTLISLLISIPIAGLITAMTGFPGAMRSLGFPVLHFGMLIMVISVLLEPLNTLLDIPVNAYSRKCEFRADRGAVDEGLGEVLISTLKKLTLNDYGNLNPHPLVVKLAYSHPPLSERIRAIRAYEEKLSTT